jgi:hypothetical protein
MAISTARRSTDHILADARYNRASLTADPKAEHLGPALKAAEEALRLAQRNTESKEDERTEKLALLLRTDFELDDRTRTVQLEVLLATGKDRSSPLYQATFPRGLSALVGLRGEVQARETKALVRALEERAPEIAKKHGGELDKLADQCISAETAWREAETAAAHAFGEERIARSELVRQMQCTEGALLAIYPGQKRRVRSYFRPTHRRGAAPDSGAPEGSEEDVE